MCGGCVLTAMCCMCLAVRGHYSFGVSRHVVVGASGGDSAAAGRLRNVCARMVAGVSGCVPAVCVISASQECTQSLWVSCCDVHVRIGGVYPSGVKNFHIGERCQGARPFVQSWRARLTTPCVTRGVFHEESRSCALVGVGIAKSKMARLAALLCTLSCASAFNLHAPMPRVTKPVALRTPAPVAQLEAFSAVAEAVPMADGAGTAALIGGLVMILTAGIPVLFIVKEKDSAAERAAGLEAGLRQEMGEEAFSASMEEEVVEEVATPPAASSSDDDEPKQRASI